MTQDILTTIGEEWYTEHDLGSISVTVGVYNDGSHSSGDNIAEGDDLAAITTEPSNTNYGRVTEALSPATRNGNWGVDNDSSFSFDFSDQTSEQWVDTFFVVYNFDSDEAGDGGTASDHLVATVAMTTDHDLGSVSSIDVAAGDIDINID